MDNDAAVSVLDQLCFKDVGDVVYINRNRAADRDFYLVVPDRNDKAVILVRDLYVSAKRNLDHALGKFVFADRLLLRILLFQVCGKRNRRLEDRRGSNGLAVKRRVIGIQIAVFRHCFRFLCCFHVFGCGALHCVVQDVLLGFNRACRTVLGGKSAKRDNADQHCHRKYHRNDRDGFSF